MPLGMYAASVPVYQRQLAAISKELEKGAAWAASKKVDEAVLMGTRLIPDMLPFSRQVQLAASPLDTQLAEVQRGQERLVVRQYAELAIDRLFTS